VVITEPPAETAAPPPPAQPVAYPVPVYIGTVASSVPQPAPPVAAPKKQNGSAPKPQTVAAPTASTNNPHGRGSRSGDAPPVQPRGNEKRYRSGEAEIVAEAVKDVTANNFAKAVTDLDRWSERYPRTDFEADRMYYYILAYNGVRQSAKLMDKAKELLNSTASLEDPRQIILALYLTALNAQSVARPTHDQVATGETAARLLLASVQDYFTPQHRPQETSEADWQKARSDLETAAKTTMARSGHR